MLLLYLVTLPFQLVSTIGWATIICVFIASFTFMGTLEIAGEIEVCTRGGIELIH